MKVSITESYHIRKKEYTMITAEIGLLLIASPTLSSPVSFSLSPVKMTIFAMDSTNDNIRLRVVENTNKTKKR